MRRYLPNIVDPSQFHDLSNSILPDIGDPDEDPYLIRRNSEGEVEVSRSSELSHGVIMVLPGPPSGNSARPAGEVP